MKKIVFILSMQIMILFSARGQDMHWQLAISNGILFNASSDAWWSGHLEDMIDFKDSSVLAGSAFGGLWLVDKSGNGRCLTDTWSHTSIMCMKRGPFSQYHVFVATDSTLMENLGPGLDNWHTLNRPSGTQTIKEITILSGPGKIVLACDNGIYWDTIPYPDRPRVYNWKPATGTAANGNYWSICSLSSQPAWSTNSTASSDPLGTNKEFNSIARTPINKDIFWVSNTGEIKTSWQVGRAAWSGNMPISAPGKADPNTRIASLARYEAHLDVFWVGPMGEIESAWWDNNNGNWLNNGFQLSGNGMATARGGIAAVARTKDNIDLFWVGPDGSIKTSAWDANNGGRWSLPTLVAAAGSAALNTRISAVARTASHLDVFWIGADGSVKSSWWDAISRDGWTNHSFSISGAGTSVASGGISAVSRNSGQLDIFWIAPDGHAMTSWWTSGNADNWNGHAYVISVSVTGAPAIDNNISAVCRNPFSLEVFWKTIDQNIGMAWWNQINATHFTSQRVVIETGAVVQFFNAISAFDEEMSVFYTDNNSEIITRNWRYNEGMILAGRKGFNNGIIRGVFKNSALASERGRVLRATGLNLNVQNLVASDNRLFTTSVGISKYALKAYMVCSDGNENAKYAYNSVDSGKTWTTCLNRGTGDNGCTTIQNCAKGQGDDYNNCIGVSPINPALVYLGWEKLYKSDNGGDSWQFLGSDHLHADQHRIRFSDFDKKGSAVYFASDGGLAATFDNAASYVSKYNKSVADLQFYTSDEAGRNSDGSFSANYKVNNLIGGGLQDNGNVWGIHGSDHWVNIGTGDGGYFTFTRQGQLVRRLIGNSLYTLGEWNSGANTLDGNGVIPITRQKPDSNNAGLTGGGFAIVNDPVAWDQYGAQVYGFGWSGTDIFSFWNPTGVAPWRWEYEKSLPLATSEYITSGGSANSRISYFCTSLGNFYKYDKQNNFVSRLPKVSGMSPAADSIFGCNRICVLKDNLAFALYNGWLGQYSKGMILKFDGTTWTKVIGVLTNGSTTIPLPDYRFYSINADWTTNPPTLLACTNQKVLKSTDLGATWTDQSAGLPKMANLADIQFVVFPNGTKRYYISTFGRSVWFADVH